jgi:hypothetical protein
MRWLEFPVRAGVVFFHFTHAKWLEQHCVTFVPSEAPAACAPPPRLRGLKPKIFRGLSARLKPCPPESHLCDSGQKCEGPERNELSPGRMRLGFARDCLAYWPKVITPKVPLP